VVQSVSAALIQADAAHLPLAGASVQCVVTSPPYWGLRDYGIAGQLGLEPTPEAYVANMVAVFREVRRVLRDDGTLWLNLGDSYANDTKWGGSTSGKHVEALHGNNGIGRGKRDTGLKAKDLCGIPWRLAFALQADGWVLRSEIIWSKPNPMPESVADRPTKAHEQLFLFSKAKWVGHGEPAIWLSETDKAWLAALVDGEGTICFQDRAEAGHAPTWSVRLSIVNTITALLDKVARICNGDGGPGAPSPRYRSDGTTGRPVYSWQVTNAKAARVIAAIRPYLIAKATQADLALSVHILNQKRKGRGGYVTTPEDLDFKRRAADACSRLNHGEQPDLSWFTPLEWGHWDSQPYAYDAEAIKEPDAYTDHPRSVLHRPEPTGGLMSPHAGIRKADGRNGGGRNRRTIWTIATQPYSGAHFATFPEELVKPCVLAGTSERGACAECGAPWERLLERTGGPPNNRFRDGLAGNCKTAHDHGTVAGSALSELYRKHGYPELKTLGWQPTCAHDAPTVPCVVLDPFVGSGTTVRVAEYLGRHAIGLDLSADYLRLAVDRTREPGLAL
jgi:DNA modification methylase